MSALAVVYDPDVFDGLDINQGRTWLDVDGVIHAIPAMLVTERLSAAAELEAMGSRLTGGVEMVAASPLHRALLDLDSVLGDPEIR